MGRQPKAADRLPAQAKATRTCAEAVAEAEEAESRRIIDVLRGELRDVSKHCTYWRAQYEESAKTVETLRAELKPVLELKKSTYEKLVPQSTAFYAHSNTLTKWLSRFDRSDVAPLVSTAMKKLDNEFGCNESLSP